MESQKIYFIGVLIKVSIRCDHSICQKPFSFDSESQLKSDLMK